jgi:hypothetical protein
MTHNLSRIDLKKATRRVHPTLARLGFKMQKKDLVTMFMESPLYFDLRVEERLALLRDHARRFASRSRLLGQSPLAKTEPVVAAVHVAPPSQGAGAGQSADSSSAISRP